MATASIRIPNKELAYYKPHERSIIKDKLKEISFNFGNFIKQASNLCNVPEILILAFNFIESAGNPKAVSHAGAIGLMQVTPATASDMIWLQNKSGLLSESQKAFIRNFIGSRLDCILSMKHMGQKIKCNGQKGISITKEDLFNPAFNTYVGTLYLSILTRLHTENGVIRLDKVVVRYNRGYFTKLQGTLEEILAKSPTETRNYIAKLIGKNSPLDILTA